MIQHIDTLGGLYHSMISMSSVDDHKVPERTARLNDWASAAAWVTNETGDDRARQLLDFLYAKGEIAVPIPGGMSVYYSSDQPGQFDSYVYLMPLLHEDRRRLPPDDPRADLLDKKNAAVARYTEGSRSIALTPFRLARLVRGLVMLHEAEHAFIDAEGSIDRTQPDSHWHEEADVFLTEFRLISILGGTAYKKLLDDSVSAIKKDPANPNRINFGWGELIERRHECFAKLGVTGEGGRRLLGGVVMFNAYWLYAQDNYPQPHHELAMFLRSRYVAAGHGKP
jgi:hypothetical protein